MARRLTYDYVKNYIETISKGKCKLLTEEKEWSNFYRPSHSKIKLLCECGELYLTSFDVFRRDTKIQCNICTNKKHGERFSIINKMSYSEYLSAIKKRAKDEYIVMTEKQYILTEKIQIKHIICGHTFEQKLSNFLNGSGCPKCYGTKLATQDEFEQKVYNTHGDDFTVIGKYINNKTSILIRHNICGHEWYAEPGSFIRRNYGCPVCDGNFINTNILKERMFEKFKNEYILLNEYIDGKTDIKVLHGVCQKSFNIKPSALMKNHNICPFCEKKKVSSGISEICKFLYDNNLDFKLEQTFKNCIKNRKKLQFDVYIPKYNLIIEYDGQHHFRPVKFGGCSYEDAVKNFIRTQVNDIFKNEFCEKNNIKLIRISYLEKKNIIEILNKNIIKYYQEV